MTTISTIHKKVQPFQPFQPFQSSLLRNSDPKMFLNVTFSQCNSTLDLEHVGSFGINLTAKTSPTVSKFLQISSVRCASSCRWGGRSSAGVVLNSKVPHRYGRVSWPRQGRINAIWTELAYKLEIEMVWNHLKSRPRHKRQVFLPIARGHLVPIHLLDSKVCRGCSWKRRSPATPPTSKFAAALATLATGPFGPTSQIDSTRIKHQCCCVLYWEIFVGAKLFPTQH